MTNLQEELKKALKQSNSAEKAEKHLVQLNKRLAAEYERNTELAKRLEKENKDFEKLEKLSLKGLFYTILGSKEKQMEKEKQEYLEASLQFDESRKSIDLMEFEQGVLEEKLAKLTGIGQKVEELQKAREKALIQSGSPQGKRLLAIAKEVDAEEKYIQEIEEALELAEQTKVVLNEMIGYLQRARNWGNWDMAGGKQMTTWIKHSNIDRARSLSHRARHLLLKFEDELRDIYTDVDQMGLTLNMDFFTRFTDFFFDNLISDWIIQQRIRNSLSTVRSVNDRVQRLAATLVARQNAGNNRIQDLEEERLSIAAG